MLTTEQYYKLVALPEQEGEKTKYLHLPVTQKISLFFSAVAYNIKQLFNNAPG